MANNKELREFNFSKGMSNVPSDGLCGDDDLAAEWNMIFRQGEHHVIQDPTVLFEGKETPYLIYVHTLGNEKRFIGLQTSANGLLLVWWRSEMKNIYLLDNSNAFTYLESEKDDIQIETIGNTLVVGLKDVGLRYYLWKPSESNGIDSEKGQYKYIGDRLPDVDVRFIMKNDKIVENSSSHDGILTYHDEERELFVNEGKQREADDLLVGLYEKNKRDLYRERYFVNPFMVRFAFELFDGTYTHISQPMPMYPSVKTNSALWLSYKYSGIIDKRDGILHMATRGHQLYYKLVSQNLRDWSDIVKDVAVFISNDVDIYDTAVSQTIKKVETYKWNGLNLSYVKADGVDCGDSLYTNIYRTKNMRNPSIDSDSREYFGCMTNKSESQLTKELSEQGSFFKLCNIGLSATEGYSSTSELIRSTDLENVTTLEKLDHDDYFSRCKLVAEEMYMYNRRLHLSGVRRGFFEGFASCVPMNYEDMNGESYVSLVYIHGRSGDVVVRNSYSTDLRQGMYYYYPDPRAYKVEIYRTSGSAGKIYSMDLKAHPYLNGAYYMRKTLPNESDNRKEGLISSSSAGVYEESTEELPNEVWVSDVNNPYVFNASGVNTVGQGRIMSVISNTTALSQGQFGQFPLICFSTDGVWALEVSSTGIYSNAKPISREICNNKDSVVATDNLIFFTSAKGLMTVSGSEVKLVSEQMGGKTYIPYGTEIKMFEDNGVAYDSHWLKYLSGCKIAYDYRDSLLWISNGSDDFETRQCYVYSMDSGAIAMKTLPISVENIVNDYPDTIIYGSYTNNNKTCHAAFSLLSRPDINEDKKRYEGFLLTRPQKMGDAMCLKGIVTRKVIANLHKEKKTSGALPPEITFRLFGSDDMEEWAQLKSFGGRGFKYYKQQILLSNLIATDTLSGVVLGIFRRYEGRMR